jgi:nicotinamidase-related amidase
MKTALIVIDMQQGSVSDTNRKHDSQGVIQRLNRLADAVRTAGGIVIFVQHDGPEGDDHYPGLPGWHLLPELDARVLDPIVRKKSCDAFLHTTLEEILQANAIDRLVITGCATDYCVDTTIRSALGRGYSTVVPMDGHTCSDRPHLPAEKVIEHHNAIWANFIAPNGPAIICPCSEVPLS